MNFEPFELERLLSDWEQTVEYNFAESGVYPVKLGELLHISGLEMEEFLETPLNYPEVNGEYSLREKIAEFYDGANLENVLVTVSMTADYWAVFLSYDLCFDFLKQNTLFVKA